jgi:ribosomal-protein-alanine N-acetyltransferase
MLEDTFLVAVTGVEVLGYVIARHAWDTGEILNVAVEPDSRGRGIAKALVDGAIQLLETAGVATVFLEVRASNVEALRLYDGMGFAEVGRRERYYSNPVDDALVLARQSGESRDVRPVDKPL